LETGANRLESCAFYFHFCCASQAWNMSTSHR
jgi:hypothetical protein